MFGLMSYRKCGRPAAERRRWRLHYCGTCKTIGSRYGQRSRMLLNHDAVFLAELLTALRGVDADAWGRAYQSWNCMAMPRGEQPAELRYAAAVTLLLAEYKVADHAADTGKGIWRAVRRLLSKGFRGAACDLREFGFPLDQAGAMLGRQSAIEAQGGSIDDFARPTAETTALVFRHGAVAVGVAKQANRLEEIGRRFGWLTYVLDAWEDFARDASGGGFNGLAAAGLNRNWAAEKIREEARWIAGELDGLGLPAAMGQRLRANIASKLAESIPHRPVCRTAPRRTLRERWQAASRRAQELEPAPMLFAAIAGMAFLFPSHAREARSSSECLSMGFNLMAVGGLLASAAGGGRKHPILPEGVSDAVQETVKEKGRWRSGCGDCCSSLDSCDGCCDAACDCVVCADLCSCSGNCCCGNCGSACSSCGEASACCNCGDCSACCNCGDCSGCCDCGGCDCACG